MKTTVAVLAFAAALPAALAYAEPELLPANNARDVNPDTRLRLEFTSAAVLGNSGKIRIYDASNDSIADELDLSVPPGPRNNRSPAPYDTLHYPSIPDTVFTVSSPDTDTSHVYQQNFVGGMEAADAHHFFPVLIDGNTATIVPHNQRLAYGKTYYVQVDPESFPLADGSFSGISDKSTWTFSTKAAAVTVDQSPWVVSTNGDADFSSVQGALDAVPDNSSTPVEIFVKNGTYEEIISFRNKQSLTLRGEDRDKVSIRYANNGVFNAKGRGAFSVSGSSDVKLINFTIQSLGKDENPAQAEALYVRGDKLQVHNVTMLGSGDALQIQQDTRIYLSQSSIRGYGDNLLSYGSAFFSSCDLISTYGPHGWPRNPESNHGDVFVNSTFSLEGQGTSGDGHCTLARSPASSPNGGTSFPYAEFVLINCKLAGIAPEGWGAIGPDAANVHFWEYNSVGLSDGKPVDVSQRAAYSRQLTMDKDAETIANYSDPAFVLGGWAPELAPVILTQLPDDLTVPAAGSIQLTADVAAAPAATFQWSKDGQVLAGDTAASLTLDAAAGSGEYSLTVQNKVGMVASKTVHVTVEGSAPSSSMPTQSGSSSVGAAGTTASAPASSNVGSPMSASSAGAAPASSASASNAATTMPATGVQKAVTTTSEPSAADGQLPVQGKRGGCAIAAPGTHAAKPALWLMLAAALAMRTTRTRRRTRRQVRATNSPS